MRWLETLVWPEHDDRRARLAAAVGLAREDPPTLVRGDLNDALPGAASSRCRRTRRWWCSTRRCWPTSPPRTGTGSPRRCRDRAVTGSATRARGCCRTVVRAERAPAGSAVGPAPFVLALDGRAGRAGPRVTAGRCTGSESVRRSRRQGNVTALTSRRPRLHRMSVDVDVLIVGAGCPASAPPATSRSGCPARRTPSSRRARRIGGTWDLFRYPGVRSDSDMYTLGYRFRPWTRRQGDRGRPVDPALRARDRARRTAWTGTSATGSAWSSALVVDRTTRAGRCATAVRRRRSPAASCGAAAATTATTRGYTPDFAGVERHFAGRVVHPQHWPEDLDYAGKRVVVIGSGATAVTLVPAMAEARARARDDAAALADLRLSRCPASTRIAGQAARAAAARGRRTP